MEIMNAEVAAVQEACTEAAQQLARELSEVQLALVGGGIGEVIVA